MHPPGSLSEGAGSPQGLTEGVSSVGCFMPMIYTPAHVNSEIFELIRSSGYTPSVSHSLDSSLREGAGRGAYHSSYRSETGTGRAIFIAPTNGVYHSSGYSLKSGVAGDFHRPYGSSEYLTAQKLPVFGAKTIPGGAGHLPYGNQRKA